MRALHTWRQERRQEGLALRAAGSGERGALRGRGHREQTRPGMQRQKKDRQMLSRHEHVLASVVVADFRRHGCKN